MPTPDPSAQIALDIEAWYNMPIDHLLREHFWENALALREDLLKRMRGRHPNLSEPWLKDVIDQSILSVAQKGDFVGMDNLEVYLSKNIIRDIQDQVKENKRHRELDAQHVRETANLKFVKRHGRYTQEPTAAYNPAADTAQAVRQAIATLSPDDRQLITAYWWEERSLTSLARARKMSIEGVRKRLHRVEDTLGYWLIAHGEVDPTVYVKTAANLKYRQVYEAAQTFDNGRGGNGDVTKARHAHAGQ
jgi:RNA polymerase sigma factor (sigma-70 family)